MNDYNIALEKHKAAIDFMDSANGRQHVSQLVEAAVKNSTSSTNVVVSMAKEHHAEIMFTLLQAETFYWSPEICRTVWSAAESLPEWTLTPEIIPVQHGFCWFAEPLTIWEDFLFGHVRAVAWAPVANFDGTRYMPFGNFTLDGKDDLVLAFFGQVDDAGILAPHALYRIPVGSTFEDFAAVAVEQSGGDVELKLKRLRAVASCFLFIQQHIFIPEKKVADRGVRRRMSQRLPKHDGTVRVVKLRTRSTSPSDHEQRREVEWTHQWLVRGHWRQQWYSSRKVYQPRWIAPYVKGPEDKPLKPPTKTIFAVVR